MTVGFAPVCRDLVIHAWGVEHLTDGYFLIIGESVDTFPDTVIPPPSGMFMKRAVIRGLKVLVQPLGQNKIRNCSIASIDLQIPLPQSMIDHVIKNVFSVVFLFMEKCANR